MAEEPLRLVLRVRPARSDGHIYWRKGEGNTVSGDAGSFNADNVFGEQSTNSHIFEGITTMVEKCCDGYNTAVMAYGQSGAGKTHTLLGNKEEEGLLTHIIKYLFKEVEQQQKGGGRTFLVQLQVMELYCEKFRDLLADDASTQKPTIMEDKNIPRVMNIQEIPVNSTEQALDLIRKAQSRRIVGATELNEQSSRSHAIVQLSVESSLTVGGESKKFRRSVMSIVDLAGSENAANNTGIRAKEGVNINLSLFTLTKVINMLTEKNVPSHIPYRESNLTRLLKPSLGGNSSTLIICCLDPQNKEETLRTLKFSERLKLVKGHVKVNEGEEGGQLNRYLDEIATLKKELTNTKEAQVEMEAKTKRLEELKAFILSGNEQCPKHTGRVNRRQTICASGRVGMAISLSPPSKKSRFFDLPKIIDEEPPQKFSDVNITTLLPGITTRTSETSDSRVSGQDRMSHLQELEDLRHQNLEYEMNIRSLEDNQEKVRILHEEKVEELKRQLTVLNAENSQLQAKINDTADIVEKHKEMCSMVEILEAENNRLKIELSETIERTDKVEIELASQKVAFEEVLKCQLEENKTLTERLAHGEMSVYEREKLISKIDEMAHTLSSANNELNLLKEAFDEKEVDNTTLKEQIERLRFDLKESISSGAIREREATEKLNIEKEKYHVLQLESSKKHDHLEAEIRTLKDQATMSLDAISLEKEKEIMRQREKIDSLEAEIQQLREDASNIRKDVAAEFEAAVSTKMAKDKERISQLEVEVARLSATNGQLVQESVEHEHLRQQHILLESEIKMKSDLLLQKEVELREQSTRITDLVKYEAEVSTLRQQLTANIKELSSKQSSVEHYQKRYQDLMLENRDYHCTVQKLQQKINQLEESLEMVKTERCQEKKRLEDQLKHESRLYQERLNGEEAKVKQLENLNRLRAREIIHLETCVSRKDRENEDLCAKIEQMTEEKRKPDDDERASLQANINDLQRRIKDEEDKNLSLEKELKKQKMIAERAWKEAEKSSGFAVSAGNNEELQSIRQDNARLRQRLLDMEDEIANMRNKENIGCTAPETLTHELRNQLSSFDERQRLTEIELDQTKKELEKTTQNLKETKDDLQKQKEKLAKGIEMYNTVLEESKIVETKYKNLKEKHAKLLAEKN